MMKRIYSLPALLALVLGLFAAVSPALPAQSTGQHLTFAGLRSSASQGQFNSVLSDSSGNLYLLLDEKDGVRVLKTDASASTILVQTLLGAAGDIGLAMTFDPSGNVYVTGTSTSGALTATSGAAFPSPIGSSVNSFIAKFDSNLNLGFLTFGGSGRTSAIGIAATADAVFITGLIYGSGLPVTPAGIIQAPAAGSMQNGFIEKFSASGKTLLYATYLSGATGDTSPTAIVADASDDAFVAGFTTASGYPTVAALIPRIVGAQGTTTGFLTRLTSAGNGITFSTFIPGDGISSLALDHTANNLLLSGSIALGQFPVANVSMPLAGTTYQVLLRMPLDGSSVLSSTVLAPGNQSTVAPGPSGTVWVDGTLSVPLLPLAALSNIGDSFALRVSPQGSQGATVVDQVARFGGLPTVNPNYASLPLTLTSLAVDASGSPVVAGSVAPTASSSLLATQTFDLPLLNSPTTALPSSVHNSVLAPGTCAGSLCAGTGAYLARLTPTAGASLALSTDASPTILLRNLGSAQATGLAIVPSGFTVATNCGSSLAAGDECTIALSGTGPGSLTVEAANATTQTVSLAAILSTTTASTLVFSPKELDFGIATSIDAPVTRTITVTNIGNVSQTFTSALNGRAGFTSYTFSEVSSDCAASGLSTNKLLAAGATCHITLGLAASSTPANDGPSNAGWLIGSGNVRLTGFAEAGALNLSSSEIDFGTQFYGGLRSARYLYISNNSGEGISHTAVTLPSGLPFTITDLCPAQLAPHTVCQLQLGYQSTQSTSSDSVTLSLDQGLSVLVTGQTIPQPGVGGAVVNPNLSLTPASISFANAVVVTGTSSTAQTVTVSNSGASPFTLSLALTGDFTDATNCGATLAGGASCSVVLTFAPSQPGARQGLLAVTAGSGTTPGYVTLSGTGTAILPANNGTLDFGNVPLGQPAVQWYKVSQPFSTLTASVTGSMFGAVLVEDIGYGHGQLPSSSFFPATTGSCLNCWLGIQFTPTVNGPQSAALTFTSAAGGDPYNLTLTGNGLAPLGVVLSPLSQDFGPVNVNSSSAAALFTLTNLTPGGSSITVGPPSVTGDFSISTNASGGASCAGTLAPNTSCFVQVLFAPSAVGKRSGTLTIPNSAAAVSAVLTGNGSPDPGIAFNPDALVFNNVPGTSATQQTITVSNTGAGTVQVGALTNGNAAFQTTTTCSSLALGATCSIAVTYVPAAATVTDTLQIPITATVGGSAVLTTYTVALVANYTTEDAGLQIIPGAVNYGPNSVNALGGTRQFTINNLTAKSLTLDLALPRQFVLSGAPCAGLAPNASCSFSVSFLPVTNGDITGTLFAQATPTDGSATLNGLGYVEGYGVGTNSLSVTGNISPGRVVNFGQVPSGQSTQQVLTLTNNSSTSVSTTDSTITIRRITSEWPFLSTTTCGATLAVNQSCTVTVIYTPLNQVAIGATSPQNNTDGGTLVIESDAVSGPDLIDLAGTGAPSAVAVPSNAPPLAAFTASQSSLTFATTPIGFASVSQFVTLANTGNSVVHITNLVTTGLTASADFTVSGNCSVLVPGASCLLTVTFTPQVSSQLSATRIGTVEISSDSSTPLEFLSLIGTASPSTLVFQPNALNFSTQLVGSITTLPLQITNAGTAPAVFNGITTTGDYAVTGTCPTSGNSLATNASCTLNVSFTPTSTGVRTGSLNVSSSVSVLPLTAALTGFGVQSHLQINPTSLNFGNVVVGANGSLSLTLANTGTAAISGIKLAIAGDYAVTSPCSFTTLSAGASCSVTVAFTPAVIGSRAGTLTITSSDATSPDAVALSGSGTNTSVISNSSFSLTVNGGASASQSVLQSRPANYTLTVTPLNGFTGTVVLGCNAVNTVPDAACSLSSSGITLNGTSQTATVTINTITSAEFRSPTLRGFNRTALCILAPAVLLFLGFRKKLPKSLRSLVLALLCCVVMVLATGCGSGGDINLRITPQGTYQYQVVASSTNGTQLTQSVTLTLIIQ